METLRLLVAIPVLLLAGCASTTHLSLRDIKEPSIVAGRAMPNVRAAPEFAAFKDEVRIGSTILWTFPTGEVAASVFSGDSATRWVVDRLSSQLTVDRRDDFPLPIFYTTARFTISCVLESKGRKVPLSSSGVGTTSLDVGLAIRMAVERALLDIAKQISIVAEEKEPNQSPEPTPMSVTPPAQESRQP